MGKATILDDLGAGRYAVRVDTGKAARDAEVSRLQALIAQLEQQIAAWQQTLDAFHEQEEAPAEAAVEAAQTAYIEAMRERPPPDAATIKALIIAHSKALQALFEVRARAALLRIQLDTWRGDLAQARKDLPRWQSLVVEHEMDVWCADYTEGAAGEVQTIEPPGEFAAGQTPLVIAPLAPDAHPVPASQVVAREVQTGAQVYFNAAILPGWQRWKPTHRVGEITAIDGQADTATVALDAAQSSAQGLQINAEAVLYDVPVRYMECNAAAFEEGDRVVVQFDAQDWETPVVIGFESEPRPCSRVYVGTEYLAHRGGISVDRYQMSALIDMTTGEVIEAWMGATLADRIFQRSTIVSYGGAPYREYVPSGGGYDHFAAGSTYRVLLSVDSPDDIGFSVPLIAPTQHKGKLYGILNDAYADMPPSSSSQRYLVELINGSEARRWEIAAANPSGSQLLYSSFAFDGHVAVGGFDSVVSSYVVRVFDIESTAKLFDLAGFDVITAVKLSRNFLTVTDWSGMRVFRRSDYAEVSSLPIQDGWNDSCVTGRLVGVADYVGGILVHSIDPQTGAMAFVRRIEPFTALVAQTGGLAGSSFASVHMTPVKMTT